MSEPEELILEGAHVATRVARDLWRRYRPPVQASVVALADVRARLELFVSALAGRRIAIAAMQPPAPPTWLSTLARGRARRAESALCGTDGERIFLPPSLKLRVSEEDTLAMYRLLAVGQVSRLMRQTARISARITRADVRDWFVFAEAAAVDRWIVDHTPGLVPTLNEARRDALMRREVTASRRGRDALETRTCAMLASDARQVTTAAADHSSADRSLEWARVAAEQHAVRAYEPIAAVAYWGELVPPSAGHVTPRHEADEGDAPDRPQRPRVAEMRRSPRVRDGAEDEDDEGAGAWMIRADEPMESVEDPFGLQRPADRAEDADPDGLADSLSELPEARVVRVPGQPREVLQSGEILKRPAGATPEAFARHVGIAYPEWDYRAGAYRSPGAIVRERSPVLGDPDWVAAALSRHAHLARRVRTRFERLRPRPVRLFRQVDGTEVDLQAYVTAVADRRAGVTPDGGLYVATRAGRRELAVALLLDVSASTDAWVSANRRIVDVEKEAMLLVCEALEGLGDRYGLYAFSGEGADDVALLPLKTFDEHTNILVRRRIAALDSDRYTRLGAPIRHVTAALGREAATSRLLLLLSDGKPNDVDLYEGPYGVEDTRQAVAEARRQGVTVFCLTVDREAPAYAQRIFGRTGFAVLRKPEQLPTVLLEVLRQLIRR